MASKPKPLSPTQRTVITELQRGCTLRAMDTPHLYNVCSPSGASQYAIRTPTVNGLYNRGYITLARMPPDARTTYVWTGRVPPLEPV